MNAMFRNNHIEIYRQKYRQKEKCPPVYALTEELGIRITTTGHGIGSGSVLYWPHYYYYRPGASAP